MDNNVITRWVYHMEISGFIQPQPGEASPPTMTNEVVLTILNMEIVSFTSIYSG